ncbi:SpoIIE family protein phosphatase [Streptomyces sp. M92]|uniref:SpoIIE family protein phosphatase n=1 Tax=Streptomyces sp. M92 TaxID=2944250 RepID=UPI0023498C6B|nr:SpoIIE family protein phosphatase [Streptomyces sp. M92]WCN05460.1 SpoIIE family protein phosphatase [Streptomyces sp. M92]
MQGRSARRNRADRPSADLSGEEKSPGRWWRVRGRSVAGQVLFLQVVVAVFLIVGAVAGLTLQARNDAEEDAQARSRAVAETLAHAPGLIAALESGDPTAGLQPYVAAAHKGTGVDFIVVMAPDGTRLADTDPGLIGERAEGVERAAGGEPFTEIYEGDPSDAARAVVPVTGDGGSVLGLVAAGVTLETVGQSLRGQIPVILASAGVALLLAVGSAALVSRRLRRQTRGIGPSEMTRMYEHHDAVLHAVREGVLITGGDGRLVLANDEARRLLDLPEDADGRHVTELGLNHATVELLRSDRPVTDQVHLAGDRLVSFNTRRTAPYGGPSGNVTTLRDTTELRALAGTAETARERLDILHEAGVRVGTTLNVVRTAEELADVAVPRFADFVTVDLLGAVTGGEEPSGAPGRMRRAALRGVRTDHPFRPAGSVVPTEAAGTPAAAAPAGARAVLETDPAGVRAYGISSLVTVPLQARGIPLGLVRFWRTGTSEPFGPEDLTFAEELTARAAVAIDNARRFTREHTMAETLQRSLLPHALPHQSGLDIAYRYLPAQARVGGDWFDVIPLPGARVALVVGDVVGHGLHAAATMGRLRTAVQNFSTLDLPPDELLTHLDELVSRLDQEDPEGRSGEAVTGATCIYAVHDPVSGLCSISRAGHLAPMLVHPDGTVETPDVPLAPPLGLGGLPFESAELRLPEGSTLVLYTDGLVERRDRDIDTGLEMLRGTLAGAQDRTPEQICEAVLGGLLPEHRRDDVALLVARTRLLDRSHVADWDVPRDPAAVGAVRNACSRQLAAWGLDDLAFTTELVLSELLTNAIRHGSEPIHVRLLHERALICEVSDGSSTSPHLRRAATTDEGGRGLFLVAQLAQRWGTRYTATGKVVWTEQSLTEPTSAEGAPPDLAAFPDLDDL